MEYIPPDYFRRLRHEEIFPDCTRPLQIDVGCGDGGFLMQMASHYPGQDFFGLERLAGRVDKIDRKSRRRGLTNAKVLRLESSYALAWLLPQGCATRVHLLFPDPWPKKRHAKNRFVQDENIQAIHQVLRQGGEFLFKTDHEDYFIEATAAVDASPLFRRIEWLGPEDFYAQTDFEQQWESQGKSIHAARWIRVDS
jgi:tRNA (guanine-N7-)-methyltransferase